METPMTRKILFITAAAMLAFGGATASAKPDADSRSDRIDTRDGSHDKADKDAKPEKKARKKSKKHKKHDEHNDCGLKRRADGETGARSPDDERYGNCPAGDEHRRSDDDYRKKDENERNDDHRRREDRVRSDDHD